MIEAIENIVNGRCKKGVRYMKPGKRFITVGDGSGGLLMQSLLKEHILPHLDIKEEELTLLDMDDSGTITGEINDTHKFYAMDHRRNDSFLFLRIHTLYPQYHMCGRRR